MSPHFKTAHDPKRIEMPLSLTDSAKRNPRDVSYMTMNSHQHITIKNISLTNVQIIMQSYEN